MRPEEWGPLQKAGCWLVAWALGCVLMGATVFAVWLVVRALAEGLGF